MSVQHKTHLSLICPLRKDTSRNTAESQKDFTRLHKSRLAFTGKPQYKSIYSSNLLMLIASGECSHHFIRDQTERWLVCIDADEIGHHKLSDRFPVKMSVMYTPSTLTLKWTSPGQKPLINLPVGKQEGWGELMRPRTYKKHRCMYA